MINNNLIMKYQSSAVWTVLVVLFAVSSVSSSPSSDLDNTLNELYESLLQREYAGPISFPDHQVERKAQRSPSLRLRFGRSDPDLASLIEKRWLGDVNQKPIRSPSLRLRFGRRNDPLMAPGLQNHYDWANDVSGLQSFMRQERKPSGRLRWGRSVPLERENENDEIDVQRSNKNMDALNSAESDTLLAILAALRELDDVQNSSNEFEREIRKPGPMRLRWGRSADNVQAAKSVTNEGTKGSSTSAGNTPQTNKN